MDKSDPDDSDYHADTIITVNSSIPSQTSSVIGMFFCVQKYSFMWHNCNNLLFAGKRGIYG